MDDKVQFGTEAGSLLRRVMAGMHSPSDAGNTSTNYHEVLPFFALRLLCKAFVHLR